MRPVPRPRLVLSRCLELDACRYNGASIRAPLVRRLEGWVELVPVCPEVEIGLGVPRDPIRLVRPAGGGGAALLVQPATGRDLTDRMDAFAAEFLTGLPEVEGFLLKARSPSCGIHGVKVFDDPVTETPRARGVGRFAAAVRARFPDHPAEDEARLANPRLLDDFLTRLFALRELRREREEGGAPLASHARHQLTRALLAPVDRAALRERLGSWSAYEAAMRSGLARAPLAAGHARVIGRLVERIGSRIDRGRAEELRHAVAEWRSGRRSRRALVERLRAGAMEAGLEMLAEQSYLNPYPVELPDQIPSTRNV